MEDSCKNRIGAVIQENRKKIIKMYEDKERVADIAKRYEVHESTIYMHLRKWGVKLRRGAYGFQKKERKHWYRKFSKEYLERRAEIQRLCGDKVEYVEDYKNGTEEQRLVSNIIQRPITG
jgi:transposase-like protein